MRPPKAAVSREVSVGFDWRLGMYDVLESVKHLLSSSGALDAAASVDTALRSALTVPGVAACAQKLVEQHRLDEADEVLRALTVFAPAEATGHIRLAFLAVQRSRWREAIDLWDVAFQRFGERSDCFWHASRAAALTRVENWQRALEDWETACARYEGVPKPAWQLDRTLAMVELGLIERARKILPECAAAAREAGGLLLPLARALTERELYPETVLLLEHATGTLTQPGLLWPRLRSLIGVGRLAEARVAFREALAEATASAVPILASLAPQLFEDAALTATLVALLERVHALTRMPDEAHVTQQLQLLALRLHLALKDFDTFLHEVESLEDPGAMGAYGASLRAVATALRRNPRLDYTCRKVFGIGLSRTATTSLATALETLGYATAHWSNPLTDQILDDADLHLFDAFADTPVCVAFEKHYFQFPNSRFIYTRRDPQQWERSWLEYFQRRWGCADFRSALERITAGESFEYGRRFIDIHMTLYFNHDSYAEAYRAYEHRVRAFFADKPPERFLILDICAGEGWEKLCDFLGHERPATPFPWHNRARYA
jgi:tetratricopeptide (TPR) repeat protein